MKATITSTDAIVEIADPRGNRALARVWEGVSEDGVAFTAYLTSVQVLSKADNSEFEKALQKHKRPSPETQRAIDMRFVL